MDKMKVYLLVHKERGPTGTFWLSYKEARTSPMLRYYPDRYEIRTGNLEVGPPLGSTGPVHLKQAIDDWLAKDKENQ